MDNRTLIIGFDPSHAARISRAWHAAGSDKPLVLALDAELEWKLESEGIHYLSANEARDRERADRFVHAEEWVTNLLHSDPWQSLTHKGVPLLTPFAFMLEFYLMQLAYCAPLLARALATMPKTDAWLICGGGTAIDAPMRTRDPDTAIFRSARWLAESYGATVEILEELPHQQQRERVSRMRFEVLRSFFGTVIMVYNSLMALMPSRSVRILASENWHNIAPFLKELRDTELMLLDRAQIRKIPLRALFAHRVRFKHTDQYVESSTDSPDTIHVELERAPAFVIDGHDISSLAGEALDTILTVRMPRLRGDIEAARAMLTSEKPHLVLLRASVSSQTHFPVLALVARSLGIPSLELQHGLEYLGPGSISREHTAEYIATYGKLVQEDLHRIGYALENVPAIGSPRFDAYHAYDAAPRLRSERPQVVVIAPDTIVPSFSSYEILEYYDGIAQALKAVSAEAVIKLRAGPERETFHRAAIARAFSGQHYRIAQYESIAETLSHAQALITCYSTVVLEACMLRVPVILAALCPNERLMIHTHFDPYAAQHAVSIADTVDDLTTVLRTLAIPGRAETQIAAAEVFLDREYAFDGESSLRMRELLLQLAKSTPALKNLEETIE